MDGWKFKSSCEVFLEFDRTYLNFSQAYERSDSDLTGRLHKHGQLLARFLRFLKYQKVFFLTRRTGLSKVSKFLINILEVFDEHRFLWPNA